MGFNQFSSFSTTIFVYIYEVKTFIFTYNYEIFSRDVLDVPKGNNFPIGKI